MKLDVQDLLSNYEGFVDVYDGEQKIGEFVSNSAIMNEFKYLTIDKWWSVKKDIIAIRINFREES